MKLQAGLPGLREKESYRVLRQAFAAACQRPGFRLCHYSVQSDHFHLIVEADDRWNLSRGLQGLFIRVSRGLNGGWGRKGRVFADRYSDRVLRTGREVRDGLAFVINNARRHGVKLPWPIDFYSTAPWFDGFVGGAPAEVTQPRPVAEPRSRLLRRGWRRHGLIRADEVPSADFLRIREEESSSG